MGIIISLGILGCTMVHPSEITHFSSCEIPDKWRVSWETHLLMEEFAKIPRCSGRRLSLDSVALMSSPSIPSSQGRRGAEQWIQQFDSTRPTAYCIVSYIIITLYIYIIYNTYDIYILYTRMCAMTTSFRDHLDLRPLKKTDL